VTIGSKCRRRVTPKIQESNFHRVLSVGCLPASKPTVRCFYGVIDLMTSPPFIEMLIMSFASRFIFVRSTIRISLLS